MKKYDLSLLIPARNEEFLARTVEDILANKKAATEVIAVMDGYWAEPGIADHPDVRVVHLSESIGQRAAQNLAARLSSAKYVAKVDAHCAFDKGFDRKLLEAFAETSDDVTMVPVMKNLHAFDWVCGHCGMRLYQGPKPEDCRNEACFGLEQSFRKDLVWEPRTKDKSGWNTPNSTAYRFNKNLQFKYFNELKKYQKGELVESMSLQGSFFMCTRERYWSLGLCDESWGSWGQQGTEVAVKTWLSGGRVICNTRTWYAHLFRTQKDFSFPYPMSGKSQDRARKISRELFLNNKWDKAVHPLSWLLERFWPALSEVSDPEARWEESDLQRLKGEPTKGIIYYTAHRKPVKLATKVQRQIRSVGLPITSATLKPMAKMGKNTVVKGTYSPLTMFRQIITALENSDADIVFFCEDDVLYHPSHFEFTPPEKNLFYYNHNWWRVREDGFAVHWDANQVSQLVCYREHALNYYRERIKEIEAEGFNRSYEPGGRDKSQYGVFWSEQPNIDFRVKGTLTGNKWKMEHFRNKATAVNFVSTTTDKIPGWDL